MVMLRRSLDAMLTTPKSALLVAGGGKSLWWSACGVHDALCGSGHWELTWGM